MAHCTTDPFCTHHRPPRTRVEQWRFNRARGAICYSCSADRWVAVTVAANEYAQALVGRIEEKYALGQANQKLLMRNLQQACAAVDCGA